MLLFFAVPAFLRCIDANAWGIFQKMAAGWSEWFTFITDSTNDSEFLSIWKVLHMILPLKSTNNCNKIRVARATFWLIWNLQYWPDTSPMWISLDKNVSNLAETFKHYFRSGFEPMENTTSSSITFDKNLYWFWLQKEWKWELLPVSLVPTHTMTH